MPVLVGTGVLGIKVNEREQEEAARCLTPLLSSSGWRLRLVRKAGAYVDMIRVYAGDVDVTVLVSIVTKCRLHEEVENGEPPTLITRSSKGIPEKLLDGLLKTRSVVEEGNGPILRCRYDTR